MARPQGILDNLDAIIIYWDAFPSYPSLNRNLNQYVSRHAIGYLASIAQPHHAASLYPRRNFYL